jgi:hypothetical protein
MIDDLRRNIAVIITIPKHPTRDKTDVLGLDTERG